jgi:hypothetical protein
VPTGAPEATAPQPSAAATAEQAARLLTAADVARLSERWDEAIGLYDEVLALEPDNAAARSGREQAATLKQVAARSLVAGRTLVRPAGKQAEFEAGSLAEVPDTSGQIAFEVDPLSPRPGDRYSARVYLTNDGKKDLEISLVTLTTSSNGRPTARNLPIREKLAPGDRTFLEDVSDVWKEGTTEWSLEVRVRTKRGDMLRNLLTWR